MFLIPGLWCIDVVVMSVFDFTLSEAMCYVIVGLALILNSEIAVPPLLIPVTLYYLGFSCWPIPLAGYSGVAVSSPIPESRGGPVLRVRRLVALGGGAYHSFWC